MASVCRQIYSIYIYIYRYVCEQLPVANSRLIVTKLGQSYPWPQWTRWLNSGRSRSKVKVGGGGMRSTSSDWLPCKHAWMTQLSDLCQARPVTLTSCPAWPVTLTDLDQLSSKEDEFHVAAVELFISLTHGSLFHVQFLTQPPYLHHHDTQMYWAPHLHFCNEYDTLQKAITGGHTNLV